MQFQAKSFGFETKTMLDKAFTKEMKATYN